MDKNTVEIITNNKILKLLVGLLPHVSLLNKSSDPHTLN